MANTTIYPFGTGGTLPSSIGVINDLTTGGADKALSAEQGKLLGAEVLGTMAVSGITWTQSKAIDAVIGSTTFGQEKTASSSYAASDYVDCGGFTHIQTKGIIVASNSSYPFSGLVFYDSEKNPIFGYNFQSSIAGNYNKKLVIPDGAEYFRTTYWYDNISNFSATLIRESVADISRDVERLVDATIDTTTLNWKSGYYIDAVSTSTNFGDDVSGINYSYHDYVLCEGYAYLTIKMFVAVSTNSGLVFYDEDFNPIIGYNLRASAGSIKTKTFQIPTNAKYFRNSYYTSSISGYTATLVSRYNFSIVKQDVENLFDVLELPPSDKVTSTYKGEKIMLDTHPFGFEVYFDATKGTGSSTARQGAACYGDTLFTFHHTNDMVEVYNMSTKQRTQVITPSGGSSSMHCNTANFSKQFYDSSDPFPLLYISNGGIEVWRITGTEGSYTMTLIQTITCGGGIDIYLAEDGTFWQIGYGGGADWDTPSDGGYIKFKQYKLPSTANSTVTISSSEAIKEITSLWRYSLQGSFIKGNKLYFVWGGSGNSGIDVIDLGSGGWLSSIDLSGNGFTPEPEGLFAWNNALYLTGHTATNVYRLYT